MILSADLLTDQLIQITTTLALLFYYALEGCDAHQVHTFIPSHFKSRSKGQVACYSCLAYTREPSNHRIFELDPPTPANISDLYAVLRKGGMRIPVYAERCAETRAGMNPNFVGAKISICPNTETEPGSCVKLKGRFNGEPYVYRNCWGDMWFDARPYQRQMSEKCLNGEMVQNFVATKRNTICFCEDDLCNGAAATAARPFRSLVDVNLIHLYHMFNLNYLINNIVHLNSQYSASLFSRFLNFLSMFLPLSCSIAFYSL